MAQPGFEGWGALGEAVAGGIGTPGAYESGLKEGYSAEKAMQDARRARSLAIIDAGRADSRAGITRELVMAAMNGDLEAQATLGAGILGGNQTMNMGQLGKFQQPHYGKNANIAQEALLGDTPDAGLHNRANALINRKEYQPVRVAGGAYMEDGVTLGELDMVPTLPTLSRMQRDEAITSQRQQRANAAVAKSNRAPAARAGAAGKAQKPDDVELQNARAAVQAGADPAAVADEMRRRGFPALAKKIYEAPKAPRMDD